MRYLFKFYFVPGDTILRNRHQLSVLCPKIFIKFAAPDVRHEQPDEED